MAISAVRRGSLNPLLAVARLDGLITIMDELQKVDDDGSGGFFEQRKADQILGTDRLFWSYFTDYAGSFAEAVFEFFWNTNRQRHRFDFRHGIYGHSFKWG
jgi:hypothetical protein